MTRWWTTVVALVVVAAVVAAFLPALDAELLNYDDDRSLIQNPHFRSLDARHLGWMFSTSWMGPYQPLAWLSLAVDHALFGFDAQAFHRSAVLLHALAALAVLGLARRLFEVAGAPLRAGPRARLVAAGGAALFFALHPLRVESVAWVTERRDVLAGLFLALAARAWVAFAERARPVVPGPRPAPTAVTLAACAGALALFLLSVDRSSSTRLALSGPGWPGLVVALGLLAAGVRAATRDVPGGTTPYAAALVCFLLALFSKGTAVVLPAVLVVLDLVPLGRRPSARLLVEKLPLFALSAAFAVLAVWGQARGSDAIASLREHGPLERALQSLYGLAYYPWRTLVPLGLTPLVELPARVALEGRFLAAAVGVALGLAAAVLLRRRLPAVPAALAAFALAITPVLGLVQVGPQLVADRYSYVACLPFALLFGAGLARLGRGGLALGLPWLAALGALTFAYARDWRDSDALWSRALEVDASSPTALFGLGTTRARAAADELDPARRRAAFREADALLERAVDAALAVDRPDPRLAAGLARVRAERARLEPEHRPDLLAEAARLSGEALELATARGVTIADYHLALGLDLLAIARPAAARQQLERYVSLEPADPRGWQALAEAEEALEHPRRAASAWRQVLHLAPGHARAAARLRALGE